MEKKKNNLKSILMQWLFPAIVFFIAVILMLFQYASAQNKSIIRRTETNINSVVKGYEGKASGLLNQVKSAQEPIVVLLDKENIETSSQTKRYLSALLVTNLIYASAVVDSDGKGICSTGDHISLDMEQFESSLNQDKTSFVFLEDNEIGGGFAIAVVTPLIRNEGYVMSFVKPELFKKRITISDYDGKTWFAIIDKGGDLVFSSFSKIPRDENFFEYLKGRTDKKQLNSIQERVPLRHQGNLMAQIGEKEIYCVFSPMSVGDWYFVMGITGSYVETINNRDWEATKKMAFNMMIALTIFFILVVAANVVNRLNYNKHSKALAEKADTDLLTELNNKIASERKIKEYIEANPDSQALMFIFDIDNFKKINDTRGHAFGDEVLRTIGVRLKAEIPVSDIIGRLGGDEFVVLMKNVDDEDAIRNKSKQVADIFYDFKVGQYSKYKVTSSIGCAVFPRDADNFEDLYKAADRGLYKAKQRGKNQLAFYREEEKEPKIF